MLDLFLFGGLYVSPVLELMPEASNVYSEHYPGWFDSSGVADIFDIKPIISRGMNKIHDLENDIPYKGWRST